MLQGTSSVWIWSAFKMRLDYIAANWCVNRFDLIPVCMGSCVLEQELENNRKQQEKFPDLKLKEYTLYVAPVRTVNWIPFREVLVRAVYFTIPEELVCSSFHPSVFQPPDVLI